MPAGGGASGTARGAAVFDDFAEFAARAITPMTIETSDRGRFFARYRAFGLDRLSFVRLDVADLNVRHAAARGGQHTFQLLYAVETGMEIEVPGQRFRLAPGEFCLLDNADPYGVEIAAPHRALDMIVPLDWLKGWVADPHAVKARPVPLGAGWGPPLASFLATLSAEIEAGQVPAPAIEHHLGGLLGMALRNVQGAEGPGGGALARRAAELIRARHDDPELSCPGLAALLGVAPRTLQKALSASGTTYQDLLTATRLERAKALLADPAMARLSIAQVAYRCGYEDCAYFSRVFAAATGAPPTRWRRCARPD